MICSISSSPKYCWARTSVHQTAWNSVSLNTTPARLTHVMTLTGTKSISVSQIHCRTFLREKLRCGDFCNLLDSLYPVLSYANKKEEESERNGSSLDHFKNQWISEFAQDVITRGLEELPKEARLHHFHHICNVLEEQQKGTMPFLFPNRYRRSRFAKRS
jgi:hypothetical protein